MPQYTIGVLERGLICAPPSVITVPANSTTSVVPKGGGAATTYNGTPIIQDQTYGGAGAGGAGFQEIGALYIQNTGANTCYISIGQIGCDGVSNYHTMLASGQQKALVNRQTVWAFCPNGGTTIAIEQYNRLTGDGGPAMNKFTQ